VTKHLQLPSLSAAVPRIPSSTEKQGVADPGQDGWAVAAAFDVFDHHRAKICWGMTALGSHAAASLR